MSKKVTIKVKKSTKLINDIPVNNIKLKMIDLCAGTGAFSHAFQNSNLVDVVFANDMDESSKKIYDENFNHKLTLKDLNDVKVEDIPYHDILTGGFPCQPFSIAGKQEGFDDERSNVFLKILEIIDYHNPNYIILENVKNLLSHDNNKTFEIVGCTPQELKDHLEKHFKEGMTWENYGLYGWHIDHIIPLASAETEEELLKLFHYTNLQPLWAEENLLKSNKITNDNTSTTDSN